jgi:acetyltransferase
MPGPAHFRALFDPTGVVVAGASTHPGKFGFVALHNILAAGYGGEVYATNRDGAEVLGRPTLTSLDELPVGAADLVFVCTPAASNPELLRQAAAKGIRAVFLASAGYGEAGAEGQRAQDELVALADELDLLIVGPNGQGVVSTPSSLCAQIVAPYPPGGVIGIASQSGNFVSSFMNLAKASGVGVSRAVSAGNAAQVGVIDFLEFYAEDPATKVALAYVEGITDGPDFARRLREVAQRLPVVVLKGGASTTGARAAASHTGSLATDDRVFDGLCRQAGVVRAATVEEAFEAAATLATQPLPTGPRVAVVTTVGGWGVVTADALAPTDLELMALPGDLLDTLDALLPPRWSRNNPIDLAGGETKDTVPLVLEAVAGHPEVDAVIFLGMGIQSNQGRLEESGPFFPDHGLSRIADFHERQDHRYTTVAAELSVRHRKPILTATELAVADPQNAAVRGVRESGRYCYPSSNRAVVALDHAWRLARWRAARGLPPLDHDLH